MLDSAAQVDSVQGVLFEGVFGKDVAVRFDAANQSSDGGALLIGGLDHTLGIGRRIVDAIDDPRQVAKTVHSLLEMVRFRPDRVRRVTIDLDPTDDPTYGQQEFACFNGHYDNQVYLPLLAFVTFHDAHGAEEPEQYLAGALLRPGDAGAAGGARSVLRRIIRKLRVLFPGVIIRVRLDGGFAGPQMLEFLEAQGVSYLVNLASNAVLERLAEPLMAQARALSERSGQSARVYGECEYAAGTWDRKRRVIIKAEVLLHSERGLKENPRFVVTNYSAAADPERLYSHTYCVRGDAENRIKELHGMALGRTSCTSFLANQFRVQLAAAAYMLMQELRRRAAGTELARAQVWRLRDALLKIGATVREVTRRVYVSLPDSAVYARIWCSIASGLGSLPQLQT